MADSYVGYSPADRLSLAMAVVTVGALNTTGTASALHFSVEICHGKLMLVGML